MIIYDYWGRPQEFEPENYILNGDIDTKKLLDKEFGKARELDLFQENDCEKLYLYDRAKDEIAYAAKKCITHNYHDEEAITAANIQEELEDVFDSKVKCTKNDIIVWQRTTLNCFCYNADGASFPFMPRNINKAIIYTYVIASLFESPGISLVVSSDTAARDYLNRYGLDDKTTLDAISERAAKEKWKAR